MNSADATIAYLHRRPAGWLERVRINTGRLVFEEKLGNWLGVLLGAAVGLLYGFAAAEIGVASTALLIVASISIPVILAAVFYPLFGVALLITVSYFLLGVKRALPGDFPLGLLTDILIAALAFGVLYKNIRDRDWCFARGVISKMVLVYGVYVLASVANPAAGCKMCYVYTIRSMAGYMVMFFVASYAIRTTAHIKLLVKLWLGLSLLAALYAIKQDVIGLAGFEEAWIHKDPERFRLLFQWGRIRKFSFMSDPAVFGINAAYSAVMALVLAFGRISLKKRIALVAASLIMLQAMLYSGTRAAFVIPPIAAGLFLVLARSKKLWGLAAMGALLLVVLILAPIDDPTVRRFQSAFQPWDDPSYQTRLANQELIRSWVWAHPLGAGLGTTGVWGARFAPGSWLAQYPPDSGFVRVAVELGWIGLTLNVLLWVTILIHGINGYFAIRDPAVKNIILVLLCVMFSLFIVNYAQQALNQLPTSLLFWVAAAMISRGSQPEDDLRSAEKAPISRTAHAMR